MPDDLMTVEVTLPNFAMLGAFGDFVFECSTECVKTFDDYKRKTAARFAEHKLIGRKPLIEFTGEDLSEISFKMKFVRDLGVNPKEAADQLREMCLSGAADYLVIGDDVIGLFVIESIDESVEFWAHGEILVNELRVRLKEYVATF